MNKYILPIILAASTLAACTDSQVQAECEELAYKRIANDPKIQENSIATVFAGSVVPGLCKQGMAKARSSGYSNTEIYWKMKNTDETEIGNLFPKKGE